MNKREQRITIAELCGYTRQEPDSVWFDTPHGEQVYIEDLPDYHDDLNACYDMWLTLSADDKIIFEAQLYNVVVGDAEYHHNDDAPLITNATALQRVEAFLRTHDLW